MPVVVGVLGTPLPQERVLGLVPLRICPFPVAIVGGAPG